MNNLVGTECVDYDMPSHNHLNRSPWASTTLTDNELAEVEIYIEEAQRELDKFYYRPLSDPNGHAYEVDTGYDVRSMVLSGEFTINMDIIHERLAANGGHPTVPVPGTNLMLLEYLQSLDIKTEEFSIDPAHYTEWLVENLYVKERLKCNRTSRNHLNTAVNDGVIKMVCNGGMFKQKIFRLANGLKFS